MVAYGRVPTENAEEADNSNEEEFPKSGGAFHAAAVGCALRWLLATILVYCLLSINSNVQKLNTEITTIAKNMPTNNSTTTANGQNIAWGLNNVNIGNFDFILFNGYDANTGKDASRDFGCGSCYTTGSCYPCRSSFLATLILSSWRRGSTYTLEGLFAKWSNNNDIPTKPDQKWFRDTMSIHLHTLTGVAPNIVEEGDSKYIFHYSKQ